MDAMLLCDPAAILAYNVGRNRAMPRFRPTARLERSALADLWKHTLSRIPSVSGRLVYLATLRDVNSGTYRHHGLTTAFGREEGVRALRQSHEEAFATWLSLSLAEKNGDLREYLMALEEPPEEVADHWLQSEVYRGYVPASAMQAETDLFCSDMATLLELLKGNAVRRRRRSSGAGRRQGSLPLA